MRSLRATLTWITVDMSMMIWMIVSFLSARSTDTRVFAGIAALVWIYFTWSDVNRWTGPKRPLLRRRREPQDGR